MLWLLRSCQVVGLRLLLRWLLRIRLLRGCLGGGAVRPATASLLVPSRPGPRTAIRHRSSSSLGLRSTPCTAVAHLNMTVSSRHGGCHAEVVPGAQ
jgi:hypothetical protein